MVELLDERSRHDDGCTSRVSIVPSSERYTYAQMVESERIIEAYRGLMKAKGSRRSTHEFSLDESTRLGALIWDLQHGEYWLGVQERFRVKDPKPRDIMAPKIRDRIVQRLLCDYVIAPVIGPRLVYDNAACQKGKGTHFALSRLKHHLESFVDVQRVEVQRSNAEGKRQGWRLNNGWVLKCDIAKYFYSIDCDILRARVFKLVKDDGIRELLDAILAQSCTRDAEGRRRGIALGNQTSQWFALLYLDVVDRLVKEHLQVRYYSRYMDDFVLVHESQEYLRHCLAEIERECDAIGLRLNAKTQIMPLRHGVDYVGFHFRVEDDGHVRMMIRQRSRIGIQRALKKLVKMYVAREIEWSEVQMVLGSWLGHASHGDTRHLIGRVHVQMNYDLQHLARVDAERTGKPSVVLPLKQLDDLFARFGA